MTVVRRVPFWEIILTTANGTPRPLELRTLPATVTEAAEKFVIMKFDETPAGATKLSSLTRMRPWAVGLFGTVKLKEPVLVTFVPKTMGKVLPPSVESSIITGRLNPPVLVQLTCAVLPICKIALLGVTLMIVSGVRSLVVSRYHPISRVCCLVKSKVSGNPVFMNGSIRRLGVTAVSQCEIEEPLAKLVGV